MRDAAWLLFAALLCSAGAGVVGDCTSQTYPKTGELPQAVNFSTTIRELHWLGGKERGADQYVFALPEARPGEVGSELWRSDGYGAANSWTNMTGSLPGLFPGRDQEWTFFAGAYQLHYPFGAAHKILLQGAGNLSWVSKDFGDSWEQVRAPGDTIGFWAQYRLHPTQPDWMLALVRRNECLRTWSLLDKWCATDLFISQDFAHSWTNLTKNSAGRIASFVDFDWGAPFRFGADGKEQHPDETIFATVYEDPKHMKGPLPAWDRNVHYVMSQNLFQNSHEKLVSCGNQFDILNNKVYLAVPNNCPYAADGSKRKVSAEDSVASSVLLYMSNDEGTSFTETCLPMGDLDLGYRMRGAIFGQGAFLVSDHDTESLASADAPVSSIYSSADNSSLFALGASRVFRRGSAVDFVAVDGLAGVYIANRLGIQALTDAAFHYSTDVTDFEKYVRSQVSFNGGAHWESLKTPQNYTHAQCKTCDAESEPWSCQLHLHGPSSWAAGEGKLPQLHTHWSAPGTVMAVGNVGEYLSFARDFTCTFLSRDGGETWQDIDPRAMVFEFGDSGGIMMMAPHQSEEPTDQITFSMDSGACWHTIQLGEAIDVIGIRVEPTASSHIFLVYGEACFQDERHLSCTHTQAGERPAGKMFALDLAALMGNEFKRCGDDAYETYSVPRPGRCLLGRNLTSTRRRPDAGCFNPKGFQFPEGIDTPCPCQEDDTECDFGYELGWFNHTRVCKPMTGFNLGTCPHVRDHSYDISASGRRLVGGDICTNISTIINDTDGRGHSTLPRGRRWPHWLLIAFGLLVATALLLGVMQLARSGAGGNAAEAVLAPLFGAYEWARARMPGRQNRSAEYYPLSDN